MDHGDEVSSSLIQHDLLVIESNPVIPQKILFENRSMNALNRYREIETYSFFVQIFRRETAMANLDPHICTVCMVFTRSIYPFA